MALSRADSTASLGTVLRRFTEVSRLRAFCLVLIFIFRLTAFRAFFGMLVFMRVAVQCVNFAGACLGQHDIGIYEQQAENNIAYTARQPDGDK